MAVKKLEEIKIGELYKVWSQNRKAFDYLLCLSINDNRNPKNKRGYCVIDFLNTSTKQPYHVILDTLHPVGEEWRLNILTKCSAEEEAAANEKG